MSKISPINEIYPASYHHDHFDDHLKFFVQERPSTPLTHENLERHSIMYHNTPVELTKKELVGRYRVSMQVEHIRAQKRKCRTEPSSSVSSASIISPSPVSSLNSTDTSWSSSNEQGRKGRHFNNHRYSNISRRETNNIVIDAPPLPFPYHNDAIFIPLAEQQARSPSPRRMRQDSYSVRSSSVSPVPSLVQYRRGRRPSSPLVWWRAGMGRRKNEVNSQQGQEQEDAVIITNEPQFPVTCQTQHYTNSNISPALPSHFTHNNTKTQFTTSATITDTMDNLPCMVLLTDKNVTPIQKSPSLNKKMKKTSVSKLKHWCQRTWRQVINK